MRNETKAQMHTLTMTSTGMETKTQKGINSKLNQEIEREHMSVIDTKLHQRH